MRNAVPDHDCGTGYNFTLLISVDWLNRANPDANQRRNMAHIVSSTQSAKGQPDSPAPKKEKFLMKNICTLLNIALLWLLLPFVSKPRNGP